MIDLVTLEQWLASATTGDTLVFCDGNPDRLANHNAEFREVFERLKQEHAAGRVYLDADLGGRCVARMFNTTEFTQDDVSNIVHGPRTPKIEELLTDADNEL